VTYKGYSGHWKSRASVSRNLAYLYITKLKLLHVQHTDQISVLYSNENSGSLSPNK